MWAAHLTHSLAELQLSIAVSVSPGCSHSSGICHALACIAERSQLVGATRWQLASIYAPSFSTSFPAARACHAKCHAVNSLFICHLPFADRRSAIANRNRNGKRGPQSPSNDSDIDRPVKVQLGCRCQGSSISICLGNSRSSTAASSMPSQLWGQNAAQLTNHPVRQLD